MTIAVGDLHLDRLNRLIPNAEDLVLSTLAKVYDYARREGVQDIVVLGDVFHTAEPNQGSVTKVIRFFRDNRDVTTHILKGNHDQTDEDNHSLRTLQLLFKYRFLTGRVYTKPRVVELQDGERYWFCPHPYTLDQPKDVRYSFGHFGYEGARGDNGFVIKNGASPRGRWVLGDYHTHQRGKNYLYPGSLYQVQFYEAPEKYFVHVTDKLRSVQVKPDLRLGRLTLASEADLAALTPDTYWSVNVGREAKLPDNWMVRYPNVVRHHTEKGVSKRQRVLMQQVANEDPLDGLADELANAGLDDPQIDRAFHLLNRKRAA